MTSRFLYAMAAVGLTLAISACSGTDGNLPGGESIVAAGGQPPGELPPASTEPPGSSPGPSDPPGSEDPPVGGTQSSGWELSVYYTAVESYHRESAVQVSGCLNLRCSSRGVIGSYPSGFVNAAKQEGTGRITSGTHAGKYLNWSYDVGYWLDTATRDSYGNALVPFVSSAADSNVMRRGDRFRVLDCGRGIDAGFCNQVKAAQWQISDEFTPGLGGPKHLDLYIGEEDQEDFERRSPKYNTLNGAVLSIF